MRIILSCSSLQDNSWAVLNYTYLFQYASTSTFGFENFCMRNLELPKKSSGVEKDSPTPEVAARLSGKLELQLAAATGIRCQNQATRIA
jgi:hypothetical protein